MTTLAQVLASSQRAPLSARAAMHAAVQIDQMSDVAFARRGLLSVPLSGAGDILVFRAALRAASADLGLLMDLAECGPDGPRLQVIAVPVPPDGFDTLPVADLMVSLYNAGTVPRLMLVLTDGTQHPMQDLLKRAAQWWQTQPI